MSRYVRIIEWDNYQHYKDRCPPWIKLHRSILNSRTWVKLDDSGRALAIAIMLLASDTCNKVPLDPEYWKRVAYLNSEPDISKLVAVGFVEIIEDGQPMLADASALLADASASLANDTQRREERKTENVTEKTPPISPPERNGVPESFDHWQSLDALVKHRAYTKKMRQTHAARIKGGWTEADICKAITRYAELCQVGKAPGYNGWSYDKLLGTGEGAWLDKMLDPHFRGIGQKLSQSERIMQEVMAEMEET